MWCEIYLCPSPGSMPGRRPTMCCKPRGARSRLGSHGVSFCESAREHLLCQAYVRLPLLATPSPLGTHAIDGCRVTFLPERRCLNKALAHRVRARSAVLVHPVFLLEEERPLRLLDSDRPWRGQEARGFVPHVKFQILVLFLLRLGLLKEGTRFYAAAQCRGFLRCKDSIHLVVRSVS